MFKYMVLTGLFRAYLLGVAIFWIHAISVAVFGQGNDRVKRIGNACLIAFIWPLAVFSPEGRKKLLSNIKQV